MSTILFVGVSLVTAPPDPARVASLSWQGSRRAEDAVRWYGDYRVLSAGLLVLCGIGVLWWW